MFFLIRNLSFTLRQEPELQLPLTRDDECVKVEDVLDLSKSVHFYSCVNYELCSMIMDHHSIFVQAVTYLF